MALESTELIRHTIAECNRLVRLASHIEVTAERTRLSHKHSYVALDEDNELYAVARQVQDLTRRLVDGTERYRDRAETELAQADAS